MADAKNTIAAVIGAAELAVSVATGGTLPSATEQLSHSHQTQAEQRMSDANRGNAGTKGESDQEQRPN